jgi:hypothetical protein
VKRFLKVAAIVVVIGVVLLVAVFFYVNNGGFVKRHVLPKVADALDTSVTAKDVKFSVFGLLELNGLSLGEAANPLFTADTVRVRYQLFPAIGGEYKVDEILLQNATVALVQNADGKLQLPFPPSEDSPAGPSEPMNPADFPAFAVKNIKVDGLTVTCDRPGGKDNDGKPTPAMHLDLQNINVDIPSITIGESIQIDITADGNFDNGPQRNAKLGNIGITISATIPNDFLITDLSAFTLEVTLPELSGDIAGVSLANRQVKTIFKNGELYVQESRNSVVEAEFTAKANLNLSLPLLDPVAQQVTGTVDIDLGVHKTGVLNLVGRLIDDYDFGSTRVSYKGKITLADNGDKIDANGKLKVTDFTFASENLKVIAIAPLAVDLNHDVGLKASSSDLDLRAFTLTVKDKKKPVVKIELSDKISLNLAGGNAAVADAAAVLDILCVNLDLAMLKPLMPADDAFTFNGGTLLTENLKVKVVDGSDKIGVTGTIKLDGLDVNLGKDQLHGVGITTSLKVRFDNMNKLVVDEMPIAITANRKKALSTIVSGTIDIRTHENEDETTTTKIDGNFALTAIEILPIITELIPASAIEGIDLSNVNLNGTITGTIANSDTFTAVVDIEADKVQIGMEGLQVPALSSTIQGTAAYSADGIVNISKSRIKIDSANGLLANLEITGNYDASEKGGRESSLQLTSHAPIVVTTFIDMLTETPEPDDAPPDAPAAPQTPLELPPLWVNLDIDIPRVTYEKIEVEGFKTRVTLKDGVATVAPATFTINGAETELMATAGLTTLPMSYSARFKTTRLGISPILKDFVPEDTLVVGDRTIMLSAVLDADCRNDMATIKTATIKVEETGTSLLDLSVTGNFDISMAGRQSKLALTSSSAINLNTVIDMLPPTVESTTPPDPEAKPATELELDLPPLWVDVTAKLPAVMYGELDVRNFDLIASMKDGKAKVTKCDFTLNDAPTTLTAACDLGVVPMTYACTLGATNLLVQPFILTFSPENADYIGDGNLKSLQVNATGKGTAWPGLMDALDADVDYTIGAVELLRFKTGSHIERLVSTAAKVVDGLEQIANLAKAFGGALGLDPDITAALDFTGLSPSDLSLTGGHGKIRAANGNVYIDSMDISTNALRLVVSGTVQAHGDYTTNLQVEPGFRGALSKVVSLSEKLETREDGYHWHSIITIDGSGKSDSLMAPLHEIIAFDFDAVTKRIIGIGRLKGEAEKLLSEELGIDGGSAVELLEGVLGDGGAGGIVEALSGLFGGPKPNPDAEKNPEEDQEQEDPTPASVNNLIRGFLR